MAPSCHFAATKQIVATGGTEDIGCAPRNGFDAGFGPYQSTRLTRYSAVSLG
jgi:hypothetical protein